MEHRENSRKSSLARYTLSKQHYIRLNPTNMSILAETIGSLPHQRGAGLCCLRTAAVLDSLRRPESPGYHNMSAPSGTLVKPKIAGKLYMFMPQVYAQNTSKWNMAYGLNTKL